MAEPATPAIQPALLDEEGVGALLGVSARHVRRLDRSGRIGPMPIRLGRCVRWSRNELEQWAAAGCPPRREWTARDAEE